MTNQPTRSDGSADRAGTAGKIDLNAGRRAFIQSLGAATGFAALGMTGLVTSARAAAPTDEDILNLALNLEYLEAEFYLRAAFGTGLDDKDVEGTGRPGRVLGGSIVPFATDAIRNYAEELAKDEQKHVRFLRAALGAAAVARPRIDLTNSFTAAARAAQIVQPTATFDAFANEDNFLLAAFIFEDVGVTAYKGAISKLANPAYLEPAAGLLAVEAYHAGTIRTVLYSRGVFGPVKRLSELRDSVDGPLDRDQDIGASQHANITPTDRDGLAFSRTPAQVLSIVYLGGTDNGGFFPRGVNGPINQGKPT